MLKLKNHFLAHKYFYMVVAITLIIVFVIAAICRVKIAANSEYVNYDLTDEVEIKKNTERLKKTSFVGETSYDGANVPYILYDVPFITEDDKNILPGADDSYFTNKELVNNIGKDEVQKFIDKSEEYVNLVFNNNYRDIAADTDSFVEKYVALDSRESLTSLSTLEDDEKANVEGYLTAEEVGQRYAQMYVDNSLTLDTKFYTDTSLVYFKYYMYWVRGMVSITPTSADHNAGEMCEPLKEMFNIDAKYGETVNFIVDISIMPTKEYNIATVTFSTVEK